MRAIWAGNTPYSKFLISVGIILVSAVLFTLLSMLAASVIYGVSMDELQLMMQQFTDPNALPIMKMVQVFSAIGTFVLPPFVLAYLFSERPSTFLSLDRSPGFSSYLLVAAIIIVATPLINYLGEINSHLHLPQSLKGVEEWMRGAEEKASDLTKAFLKMDNLPDLFLNLFMIALLPAMGEELLFRGVIQRLFGQWMKNIHAAIWITAILFSAMHVQFYGFLPRMVLGAMLGYMLAWSGSLWLPVTAHFINNAAAVLFTYLFQHGLMATDPDKVGTGNDVMAVIASFVITVILFGILYRRERVSPLSP